MISKLDKLKLKLLDYSETERLDRHANVEVAFAEGQRKIELLEEALKISNRQKSELREELKQIVDAHTQEPAIILEEASLSEVVKHYQEEIDKKKSFKQKFGDDGYN